MNDLQSHENWAERAIDKWWDWMETIFLEGRHKYPKPLRILLVAFGFMTFIISSPGVSLLLLIHATIIGYREV